MDFNGRSFDHFPSSNRSSFTFARPFAPCSSVMAGSRYRPSTPQHQTPASRSYPPLPSPGTSSPSLPIAPCSDLTIPPSQYLIPTPPSSSGPEHILAQRSSVPTAASPRRILDQLTSFLHPRKPSLSELQIGHVSVDTFDTFLTKYSESTLLNHTKLDYDAAKQRIILCAPPTPYHDCMPSFLQETLTGLRGTPFDTPARQRTLRVTQVSWRAPDGSYLVPDAAISVMGLQPRVWPSLVVEVANTQSYQSATAKVARWFTLSEGAVEVALLMKFTAPDAMLDPACFVEVWRSRLGSSGTPVDAAGAADPADRGAPDRSSNVVESSDEDSPDEVSATNDNPDAPYGSALPASTIYRDGPRLTVYPAPAPPTIQTPITLRYSDLFGIENVPPGRDPLEPVLLDLEVLREVLIEFVQLTRAQVASVKRKHEGEGREVTDVLVPMTEEAVSAEERQEQATGGRSAGKRVRR